MPSTRKKTARRPMEYVRETESETHRVLEELRAENSALSGQLAVKSAEVERLAAQVDEMVALRKQIEDLRRAASSQAALLSDRDYALAVAKQEKEASERALASLRDRLTVAERDSRRFSDRCGLVERKTSNLTNLYVASYRLHESLEVADLVQVIRELVANLVGSEEAAVYRLMADGSLERLDDGQAPTQAPSKIAAGVGRLGECVATGEVWTRVGDEAPAVPHEKALTACVPLRAGARTVGAVGVWRLLSHKPALEPIDHELFGLLSYQAGVVLACAEHRGGAPGAAAERRDGGSA